MLTRVGPEGLEIARITATGRRHYTQASKARVVAACLQPGASVARVALDHDVNANLLRKWIQKRLGQTASSGSSAPAIVGDASAFVRVTTPTRHTAGSDAFSARLSAEMPNGVRVALEGQNPQMLATMIDALGRI